MMQCIMLPKNLHIFVSKHILPPVQYSPLTHLIGMFLRLKVILDRLVLQDLLVPLVLLAQLDLRVQQDLPVQLDLLSYWACWR